MAGSPLRWRSSGIPEGDSRVTFALPYVMDWRQAPSIDAAMNPVSPANPDPGEFRTTRWTRVCRARDDSEDGRVALAELCEAYYEPVIAYLRGVLHDADSARELAHAFFAEILAGGAFRTAEPGRGRFRFYLLGAVKHFLAHHREAQGRLKRGGGATVLSLDAESPDGMVLSLPADGGPSPEAAYDRQWAVTLLARSLEVLRCECAVEGKAALFEKLRPMLLGEAVYGDQLAIAAEHGLSPAVLKVVAHRLRHRFRQCVKDEIAGTLPDRSSVEDEMRALYGALSG